MDRTLGIERQRVVLPAISRRESRGQADQPGKEQSENGMSGKHGKVFASDGARGLYQTASRRSKVLL